jgi:hypothetical protein
MRRAVQGSDTIAAGFARDPMTSSHTQLSPAATVVLAMPFLLPLVAMPTPLASAQDTTLFAVVTQVPKDKRQVTAHVSVGGAVSETTLIPSEAVSENLIWRKLEICHSLRAEASKVSEGYRLQSVKILDAGMLPMQLQGVAGDCLLKKALEFAPLVD